MKKNNQELSLINVALMYVSVIMGAGFASGREIWQFFGVFGDKGRLGVTFVAILFVIVGMMTSYIARKLNTNDMGRVIVPGNNKVLISIVGYFMAVMLMTVMVTMCAAAGSLFNQQFGLPVPLGGIVLAVLSVITIFGNFERISKVFRLIMPALFAIVIIACILVIFWNFDSSGYNDPIEPSPIAGNCILAAFLYISYNILALIPFVSTTAVNAKNDRAGIVGSGLGGIFLGLLAMLIVLALQRDMPFAQAMDMPMLAYSMRVSKPIGYVFMVVLFFAIYSAATSNFYGVTTKIKEGKNKKKIIIGLVAFSYAASLVGFKNIIEYLFPIYGYLGFAIMFLITVNFFKVYRENKK